MAVRLPAPPRVTLPVVTTARGLVRDLLTVSKPSRPVLPGVGAHRHPEAPHVEHAAIAGLYSVRFAFLLACHTLYTGDSAPISRNLQALNILGILRYLNIYVKFVGPGRYKE